MIKRKLVVAILVALCLVGTTACSLDFLPSEKVVSEQTGIDENSTVKPVSIDDINKTKDVSVDTKVGEGQTSGIVDNEVKVAPTPVASLDDLIAKYLGKDGGVVESEMKLSGLETIKMSNVNYPLKVKLGDKFELEGQIECNEKVFDELIGEVLDLEGNVILTATGKLEHGKYNIRPNIVNTGIKFGKLALGDYIYKLYVDGPDVERVEIFSHDFKVVEQK